MQEAEAPSSTESRTGRPELEKTFEDKSATSGSLDKLLDETNLRVLEGNRQWKPILVQTQGVPPGAS